LVLNALAAGLAEHRQAPHKDYYSIMTTHQQPNWFERRQNALDIAESALEG
jgi:hypothetical protein